MTSRLVAVIALSLFGCSLAKAQTALNPDISAVGDFRLFSHNDEARDERKEEVNLANPELELNIGGYLNPYARADVVVAWHGDHNAEIEELYATILRGLPLGINLRVGKYLLEFGRLNPVHPHAYSFIQRPLPHEMFFGEEGLADMAVRAGFLLPMGDAYTELMAGLLKGDILTGHKHHQHEEEGEEHEEADEEDRDLGFFGRLTSSLAVSESAELAIGASVVNAVYAIHEHKDEEEDHGEPRQLRSWLFGGDIKYKYKPSRYTTVQIEAEGIARMDEQAGDENNLTSYGAYAYIDYLFNQKYNIGGVFEWACKEEAVHHDGAEEHNMQKHDTWRAGLFVGFAPIEETSLVRLAGHWTESEEGDGFWEATLQLVFSLGPHKPHNF
ncbi:MAG: hypothetical protein KKG33_15130 [candidate division Zixibacteria bacterium]|nr:hypothetical protein [candidate division Zixibacteria bacterium]MBU1470527.1 hypothetical protein [candidate division Zixibacteria bacterium]MBU2626885.1 hypothetical protein [candidate division Zixibacteria bacterium]